MKYILGIGLLLFALDTFAWETDNSKSLSDLLYIPNVGRFFGQTGLEWVSLSGEIGVTGGDVDITSSQTTFAQELGYGLTDRLQLVLQYQNQLKGRTARENNGNFDNEGPANPLAKVQYRLLKQEEDSITLDLNLAYSPDLFDSESNSVKNETDNASGGSSLILGGRAGKKFTNLEMKGELSIRFNGKSESRDTVSKDKTKTEANAETRLAYYVQFPLENKFWARALLERVITGEVKSKDSSGDTSKADSYSSGQLAGSLLYMPVDGHLVLEAGVGLISASDFEVKTGNQKNKFRDFSGSRVFLTALYQF